ncbi:hypothetical protein [Zoogloea sp.]|uniref:hypothetical protein n=1 Tax=Zoogloea sp. TaxID=49181 RepID=UPI00261AFED3|nr:hypothetical protein [uncultured Zoogloea sp.]
MHDDYDFTATFDFSDSDWKAIDQALALLEEKFAMLDDIDGEADEGDFPFDAAAEAYTRKAIGELRKEWVHFVDDSWTDLDEIRGHLLSIDQLRPRLRRLRELCRRGQANVHVIGSEAYDACMLGEFKLERIGRSGPLKRIHEMSTEMRKPHVKALLRDCENTSLVDDESEDPGS